RQIPVTIAKTSAVAPAGYDPGLAKAYELFGVQGEVDPTGNSEGALLLQEALARHVHSAQGRGAHGVDRQARPLQIEEVGDAVGDGAKGGERDGGGAVRLSIPQVIVLVHGADEHADLALIALLQALAGIAGLLEQVPHGLQEKPF